MKVLKHKLPPGYLSMSNSTARFKGLSLVAVGLLAWMLAHPVEAGKLTTDQIADEVTEGRATVRRAMRELESAGYVSRPRERGEDGTVKTLFLVSNVAGNWATPNVTEPAAGSPDSRSTGAQTHGGTSLGKTQPQAPRRKDGPDEAPQVDEAAPKGPGKGDSVNEENPGLVGAVKALQLITAADSRLRLSAADVATLAPLVATWLDRAPSVPGLVDDMTAGLPERIRSPRALLAARLELKMPAVPAAPPAPAGPRAVCCYCATSFALDGPRPAGRAFCPDCTPDSPQAADETADEAAPDVDDSPAPRLVDEAPQDRTAADEAGAAYLARIRAGREQRAAKARAPRECSASAYPASLR